VTYIRVATGIRAVELLTPHDASFAKRARAHGGCLAFREGKLSKILRQSDGQLRPARQSPRRGATSTMAASPRGRRASPPNMPRSEPSCGCPGLHRSLSRWRRAAADLLKQKPKPTRDRSATRACTHKRLASALRHKPENICSSETTGFDPKRSLVLR
jgi:hypothetical protein